MQDEGFSTQTNLEICPNCLEPNSRDLANCAHCGMPLREVDLEKGESLVVDGLSSNTESADSAQKEAPAEKKPEKRRNFSYMMRGMGVYLIIMAIMEIPRSLKLEVPKERNLALLSNAIYLIAGGLIAWPILKEYLDKRKKKAQEQEEPTDVVDVIDLPNTDSQDGPIQPTVVDADEPDADLAEKQEPSDGQNQQI